MIDASLISNITEIKKKVDTVIEIAESPLGRSVRDISPNSVKSVIETSICFLKKINSHCPIEGNNGKWDNGERGDGKWFPDKESIPGKSNPENKTFGEILSEYKIDFIQFKDGNPDFTEISKGQVEIKPFSLSRSDNFDLADIKLAEQRKCSPEEVYNWRKANHYTWHECKDMKTMQKVPSIIHNNIPHSGGISELKNKSNNEV